MAGYICIAMLEDPPYSLYLAATEQEPEEWVAELPLPSHLLCFERFADPKAITKQCTRQLKIEGIEIKPGKAFMAQPCEVVNIFMKIRDDALKNNHVMSVDGGDCEYEEGSRLYHLAREYNYGSDSVIPDLKKAFKLYMQSAEHGYDPAYLALARAYQSGEGIKKDLNEALRWARKDIELNSPHSYGVATKCFLEAGMTKQAEDLWVRYFKEFDGQEDIMVNLHDYAEQVCNGRIRPLHTVESAKRFGEVAKKLSAYKYSYWDDAVAWLLKNKL